MKKSNAVAKADPVIVVDELVDAGVFGIHNIIEIRISPDNRKRFNQAALEELAASIKTDGVAQPILIRPVIPTAEQPEVYEIVAGERRYRASKIAGRTNIPAMVRVLTNLQAAKIRILENLQREDPHPMEEAEGYEQLMLKHGYSADQLAEEIKKSRAYVYGRLKLCSLTSLVRQQFLEGAIPASTALLIARIAVPNLQLQAYNEIVRDEDPMSYREAAAHIQHRYMLDLTVAPFQMSDAKLLASAGSCTKCPKRTGNQPEVFTDISADVCTDPDCFTEKRHAVTARLVVEANKKGIPVLEGEDAESFMDEHDDLCVETEWVSSFDRVKDYSKHYSTKVGTLLEKGNTPEVKAYIKEGETLIAVYGDAALQAAMEKAGVCATEAERQAQNETGPNSKKEVSARVKAEEEAVAAIKLQAANEQLYRVALYKQFREKGAAGFSLKSLREITKLLFVSASLPDDILDGVYTFDASKAASVNAHIDQADVPELQLLLVDLIVGETLTVGYWDVKNGDATNDDFNKFVIAMVNAEGIEPDLVREQVIPTPLDTAALQYDDLVRIIKATPERINELSRAVLANGYLVTGLELAAKNNGFVYGTNGFVRADAVVEEPAAAEESKQPEGKDDDAELLAQQAAEDAAKPAASTKKTKAAKARVTAILKPAVAWPFPKTAAEALDKSGAAATTESPSDAESNTQTAAA